MKGSEEEGSDCSNGLGTVRSNTRGLVSQPTATAVVDQVGFFTATLAAACPAKVPGRPQQNVLRIPHSQTTVHGPGERRVHIMDGSPTIFPPILPLHRNRLRPYLGVVDRPDHGEAVMVDSISDRTVGDSREQAAITRPRFKHIFYLCRSCIDWPSGRACSGFRSDRMERWRGVKIRPPTQTAVIPSYARSGMARDS